MTFRCSLMRSAHKYGLEGRVNIGIRSSPMYSMDNGKRRKFELLGLTGLRACLDGGTLAHQRLEGFGFTK
jgi:hypothetical protein